MYIFGLIASSNGTLSSTTDNASEVEVLRDIKGFYAIEVPLWFWILLGTLATAILGYWIYIKFIKKKINYDLGIYEATVKALKDLDLRQNSKDFYLSYSELIKFYLEKRLKVAVLDKTAEEIKECLISIPQVQTNQALAFTGIFQRGDLAKFALKEISAEEKSRDIEQSLEIIRTIEEAVLIKEAEEAKLSELK